MIELKDYIFIGLIVFFALIAGYFLLRRLLGRKKIINALLITKATLKEQLVNDETTLKKAIEPLSNSYLEEQVSKIIAKEHEVYKSLASTYIHYHAAAVEILPFAMNQIMGAYIQLIENIVRAVPEAVQLADDPSIDVSESAEEEVIDELFQYESLIEQLRIEKADFADKCKFYGLIIAQIYTQYHEQLGLPEQKDVQLMSIDRLKEIFKLETQ